MAKRKNGEGSWGEKVVNGKKYKYLKVSYPHLTYQQHFYGKTEKEIKAKRKEYEEKLAAGKIVAKDTKDQTFGNYAEWYLKSRKNKVSAQTYDSYEYTIKRVKNLKEYDLYNKQMGRLSEKICEDFIEALTEHGYSAKTIKSTHDFVSSCMANAVEEGRLTKNYMKSVKTTSEKNAKKKKKEITFFSKMEMEQFCSNALHIETEQERYNPSQDIGEYTYGNNGLILAFIGQTGLRVGEAIGLKWDDINFDKGLIEVANSEGYVIERDDNGDPIKRQDHTGKETNKRVRQRKETKTEAGVRYVPMTDLVKEILQHQLEHRNPKDDMVFLNIKGNPLNKDNLRRSLTSICNRYGLPRVTPHELRHSYGSIILHQENVDIQIVSKLLGHKDITTTYNIYAHVLDEIMAESVQIFNKPIK